MGLAKPIDIPAAEKRSSSNHRIMTEPIAEWEAPIALHELRLRIKQERKLSDLERYHGVRVQLLFCRASKCPADLV